MKPPCLSFLILKVKAQRDINILFEANFVHGGSPNTFKI